MLLDAGVELDSLYTADITRTFPVSGTFTPVQRQVYEAVREAADAALAIVRPGIRFREVHAEAMKVIAARTAEWGLLPVSAEESLEPDAQFHRRYMVHGTSHHLGIDVHDCAQARRELYLDGVLEPGMVFTIEPGLYFQPDDLTVPEEYRGIGVRIEDDILVTDDRRREPVDRDPAHGGRRGGVAGALAISAALDTLPGSRGSVSRSFLRASRRCFSTSRRALTVSLYFGSRSASSPIGSAIGGRGAGRAGAAAM